MDLKSFLKERFGKDLFTHLKGDDILEERMRAEKKIEGISDDIKDIQQQIQSLMLASKGQPEPVKLLNISKIKTLRLESAAKMQEADGYLKEIQVLLLIEAMKEHHKKDEKNKFVEKVLNTDLDHLRKILFNEDLKKAIEEGKLDHVREALRRAFAKEEMPADAETQEMLLVINDLEKVDESTAAQLAAEKAKQLAETPRLKHLQEE
ncbi:MAG: hypothetical protein KKA90_02350 [Nanoarchaeota archaeon]|nr:hypothetical protein [Nanoarchaeota archaeon]